MSPFPPNGDDGSRGTYLPFAWRPASLRSYVDEPM